MKSRLAMTAMLVSGLLMSGTGATLAVSDSAPNSDAAATQYGTSTPTPPTTPPTTVQEAPTPAPQGNVLPQSTESTPAAPAPAPRTSDTPAATPDEPAEKGDVAPATSREQGAAPADDAQPAEQVKANGTSELPFTGFAAIPILVGGIALMGGGLVMRRRTAA